MISAPSEPVDTAGWISGDAATGTTSPTRKATGARIFSIIESFSALIRAAMPVMAS
jgi:hypothetical protein